MPDGLSPKIQLRLAPVPHGPWGEPITVYECPEAKWHESIFCYAAKGHADISLAREELIVTYVANSGNFWYMAGHASLYWPCFLRITFQPPDPQMGD